MTKSVGYKIKTGEKETRLWPGINKSPLVSISTELLRSTVRIDEKLTSIRS